MAEGPDHDQKAAIAAAIDPYYYPPERPRLRYYYPPEELPEEHYERPRYERPYPEPPERPPDLLIPERVYRSPYERALSEQGSVEVAYGRIMLLGSAGVGKTSLKRSFMSLPWDPNTNSTIVSDVSSVRPFQHEWSKMSGEQWKEVTEKDEMEEIAQLMAKSRSMCSISSHTTEDASALFPIKAMMKARSVSSTKVKEIERKEVDSILTEATQFSSTIDDPESVQPYMNIWDCGGQPVFLEILPAFLTPRTAFLLLFDASRDFGERWQSVQTTDGQQSFDEEINETTGDLMVNWMSTVHGHLVKHNEDGNIPNSPRLFCVGTHGDKLTGNEKEKVKEKLQLLCKGKAFSELIEDILIVDNTTSGKGEHEDPNISKLRNALGVFVSEKLIVKTPVNWVLFRKVLQSYKKNVIDQSEAHAIGVACKIPPADVPKVLMFYHQVGAVLFYPHIEGLRSKVIINPKWFVDILGKVFTLKRKEIPIKLNDDFSLLQEKGILVQPYYVSVWSASSDHLDPEGIMELLVHFRLAAQVHTRDKIKQYFLPAVLKGFKGDPQEAPPGHNLRATPLHITFSTGYVPPGFFTRFATTMARESICELIFEDDNGICIYRNRVSFLYGRDHLILTDLHYAIQVDVLRYAPESSSVVPFKRVCQELLSLLEKCCQQVDHTLFFYEGDSFFLKIWKNFKNLFQKKQKPSELTREYRYVCGCTSSDELHYLVIAGRQTSALPVHCQKRRATRPLTLQESMWFEGDIITEEHYSTATIPSSSTPGTIPPHSPSTDTVTPFPETATLTHDSSPIVHPVITVEPTHKDLMNDVAAIVPDQWRNVGILLGLTRSQLNAIDDEEHSKTLRCFSAVFNQWCDCRDPPYTWETILKCLESPLVNRTDVAKAIRRKYL